MANSASKNANCPTARFDPQGHYFKTVMGVKYDGTRRLPDLLANMLSKRLSRAKITHMGGVGGFKKTCKGLFTEFANQLPKPDPKNTPHAADLRYMASSPMSCLTPRR